MSVLTHTRILRRPGVQKVSQTMGLIFVVLGLMGVVKPDLFGLHLSFAHNLILLVSGSLSLWSSFSHHSIKAYALSCVLGTAYAVTGILGFVFGKSGYPSVGDTSADPSLWRIIPDVLEFGSSDHTLHLFIGSVFLFAAYYWKSHVESISRILIDVQRRKLR